MKTKKFALNFLCKIVNEMKNEDDNIQFEQMPDLDWGKVQKPKPNKEIEKEYDSLYDELLDKCNPRFKIELVGLERFNSANEIYAQLKSGGSDMPETILIALRNQAMDELEISISTRKKFNYLKSFLDPNNYINRQPYDKELVAKAGACYEQLLNHKDDIRFLESLEDELQVTCIKDEYDYLNLEAEEYLKEHPEGHHKSEAMESLQSLIQQKESWEEKEEEQYYRSYSSIDYLIKYPDGKYAQKARHSVENAEFFGNTAEVYLKHYPQGEFSDEARCFLQNSGREYRKKYPNGRYVQDINDKWAMIAFVGLMAALLVFVIIIGIVQ